MIVIVKHELQFFKIKVVITQKRLITGPIYIALFPSL